MTGRHPRPDAGTDEPLVPPRTVPGPAGALSSITLDLAAAPSPAAPGLDLVVPLVQRARALGVTTFDLGTVGTGAAREEAFVRAFARADPAIVVILRWEPPDGRTRPSGGRTTDRPTLDPLSEALDRLGGRYRVLVEGGDPDPAAPVPAAIVRAISEGRAVDRVRPLGPPRHGTEREGLVSAAFSLIEPRLAARGAGRSGAVIARDVFAGGSLDGSFLRGPGLRAGPAARPASLADLHARLDPIADLDFLTRRRRRTLIDAALGFVLQWPWVATAVVPVPPPERLVPVLTAARSPPLDADEVARLLDGASTRPG